MAFATLPTEFVGEPQRPKCQVPNCGRNAQTKEKIDKWVFRKSSWVAEKYNVHPGYCCAKHHDEYYGMTITESYFDKV